MAWKDKEFGQLTLSFSNFWLIASVIFNFVEKSNFENPENQTKWWASLLILNELSKKMVATKIFVSLSRSSWCTSFLLKTRFKESYCKWSKAIICDRKKCLYFLGLYKSLRVVSKFMHLEWCRRETNQIPRRSARTNEEFGLITCFFFKLLSHKLLSDPSGWFSIMLENENFENPENHSVL